MTGTEQPGLSPLKRALVALEAMQDRLDEIERIVITTHESAIRIISKVGPLANPADRDHCLQYMTAVPLIFGDLVAGHDGGPELSFAVPVVGGVGALDHGAVAIIEPEAGAHRKREPIEVKIEAQSSGRCQSKPPQHRTVVQLRPRSGAVGSDGGFVARGEAHRRGHARRLTGGVLGEIGRGVHRRHLQPGHRLEARRRQQKAGRQASTDRGAGRLGGELVVSDARPGACFTLKLPLDRGETA